MSGPIDSPTIIKRAGLVEEQLKYRDLTVKDIKRVFYVKNESAYQSVVRYLVDNDLMHCIGTVPGSKSREKIYRRGPGVEECVERHLKSPFNAKNCKKQEWWTQLELCKMLGNNSKTDVSYCESIA